jgi:hypothetical protein
LPERATFSPRLFLVSAPTIPTRISSWLTAEPRLEIVDSALWFTVAPNRPIDSKRRAQIGNTPRATRGIKASHRPNHQRRKYLHFQCGAKSSGVESRNCRSREPTARWVFIPGRSERAANHQWSGGAIGSSILLRVYPELLHSGEEGCAIDAHARGSSVSAAHAAPAFREGAHDLFALFPGMFVRGGFLVL